MNETKRKLVKDIYEGTVRLILDEDLVALLDEIDDLKVELQKYRDLLENISCTL